MGFCVTVVDSGGDMCYTLLPEDLHLVGGWLFISFIHSFVETLSGLSEGLNYEWNVE